MKHQAFQFGRFTRLMAALTLAWTWPLSGQVTVHLGDVPDGETVTVSFEVEISGLTFGVVSNQGEVSGVNFPTFLTDDPETPAPTDPTVTEVSLGQPRIINVRSSLDLITFDFQTFAGYTYYVEATSRLGPAAWGTLGSIIGDGSVKTYSRSIIPSNQRYYRLRIESSPANP